MNIKEFGRLLLEFLQFKPNPYHPMVWINGEPWIGKDISIGGFSFHRLLESGQQDIFKYIADCKELGATQLDPWNAQLAPIQSADSVVKAGSDPAHAKLSAKDDDYLLCVRQASDDAGLPFGCIAVDGAHIYEPTAEARAANRRLADRWLEVAALLGAQ